MNWGVIGYGEIAPSFIEGLKAVQGQQLFAIASKSKHEILNSENRYPTARIFSDYETLLKQTEIDIVYICTTNNLHKENVISALKAGKHVLSEKPIGVCRQDTLEMFEEAKRQSRFLMEGMWTRFLPAYKYFKELLNNETIGQINFARIDFGFSSNWSNERRLMNQKLFGGAMLDNGDYNLFLSQDIFGQMPKRISAFARKAETGVEDLCGVMLQYPDGTISQLFCGFHQKTRQEALIYGEKGHIRLQEFWRGTVVEITTDKGEEVKQFPFRANGFEYEIEEVVKCINEGKIQSEVISHEMSLEVASIMDEAINEIRK
jgi:predicted dehydrogenase